MNDPRLTPRAKRALELAVKRAEAWGSDTVGPEHLLLGIVEEAENIGAGVLDSLGVSRKIEEAIAYILGKTPHPQRCPTCARSYVPQNGPVVNRCAALHHPGTCCHYGEREVTP